MRISLAGPSCDTPDFGNVAMKKLIERWAFLLSEYLPEPIMKTIKFQNNEFQFNDVHIAKAGDKAWNYAWGIADEFGYLAPCVIESLPDEDNNEMILAVDREDKCKAECIAIICSKEKSPMFPSLTKDARCMGFQFVYEGDQFEVL